MERVSIAEARRDLDGLIDRITARGESIQLERDECVIATIVPTPPANRKVCQTMDDLAALLNSLPRLGDDAEAFARDVEEARNSYPPQYGAANKDGS